MTYRIQDGRGKRINGFTLIELLVTVAMVAILASLAVPSFSSYIAKNSIFSLNADFGSALMVARSEAQNRNKTVAVCPTSDGTTCSLVWSDGWIVFIDDGTGSGGEARDGELNGSEEIINAFLYKGKNSLSILALNDTDTSISSLSFNERGRPALNGVQTSRQVLITVCDQSKNAKLARGMVMVASGRLLHTRDNNSDGYHESKFTEKAEESDSVEDAASNTNLSCS